MKLFKQIFLIASFLFLFMTAATADITSYEYWVESNTVRTFDWSPVNGAEGYELYIWQIESSKRLLSGRIVTTNSHTIKWTTRGHYVIYVRHFKTVDGVRQFGEWGNSLDPATGIVNGNPQPWVIYVFTK